MKKPDFKKLLLHDTHFLFVRGLEIKVNKEVFSPDPNLTNSPHIIFNHFPNLRGKSVLDMGSGTGILAIACAKKGAKNVLAVDIDEKAVENTIENVEKFYLKNKIKVIKSNLFENVEGKFDIIFANLPIEEELWGDINTLSIIRRFLLEAKNYLTSAGKIYLTWFSIKDVKPIRKYCLAQKYKIKENIEKKFGFDWYLFELSFDK